MIQPTDSSACRESRLETDAEAAARTRAELHNRTPIADLLRDLRDEMLRLVRQEIALARAEVVQKARAAAKHLALVAAGGVMALMALWFGLLALAVILTLGIMATGIGIAWSAFVGTIIVCLLTGVAAFALINYGLTRLKNQPLTPQRTIDTLQENSQWLKQKAT